MYLTFHLICCLHLDKAIRKPVGLISGAFAQKIIVKNLESVFLAVNFLQNQLTH